MMDYDTRILEQVKRGRIAESGHDRKRERTVVAGWEMTGCLDQVDWGIAHSPVHLEKVGLARTHCWALEAWDLAMSHCWALGVWGLAS